MAVLEITDQLRSAATYMGVAGERWLEALPGVVESLEANWRVACGRALSGGNFAYVADAVTADGGRAVLKVALPSQDVRFEHELRAFQLAQGDPYARLLNFDEARRSLLLERLGRPMAELGWPISRQISEMVGTLARGWRTVDEGALETGAEKAKWLADFIEQTWRTLDRPCSERAIERALGYAAERAQALNGRQPVLVHGDAHPWNILERRGAPRVGQPGEHFRLIDPEGLASEPAHDLGVVLRGWNPELLRRDTAEAAFERSEAVFRQTGVDRESTWQWSYVERVSSGLFLTVLGQAAEGRPFLEVADRLANVTPPWIDR